MHTHTRVCVCQTQWLRGLKRGTAVACLLGRWVRIRPGHECLSLLIVVLSGRGLCDRLITRLSVIM